jgi:predicted  nucleic acid-binding Zn-ribbon protein
MAENNAVTKEDLKNALNELWDKINSRFEGVDHRFEGVDRRFEGVDRRFDRADRERRAFRDEVNNRFYEIDGKIMHRFDLAKEHADQAVERLSREWTTVMERQAGVTDNLRLDQMTMGAVQDQLQEATKSHGGEITDLKRRVAALEEEALPSPDDKD